MIAFIQIYFFICMGRGIILGSLVASLSFVIFALFLDFVLSIDDNFYRHFESRDWLLAGALIILNIFVIWFFHSKKFVIYLPFFSSLIL